MYFSASHACTIFHKVIKIYHRSVFLTESVLKLFLFKFLFFEKNINGILCFDNISRFILYNFIVLLYFFNNIFTSSCCYSLTIIPS